MSPSILRRKRLPPELVGAADAFAAVLEELEPAKVALTEVLPGTRAPGRPLPEALATFTAGLGRARDRMPGWRVEPVAAEWTACETGIEASLAAAERAATFAPAGFESLLWLVEELLDPLEPFAEAERAFRALRR
ncbi:MAG TPA: hypothetical protein VK646_07215 [Actinomycetota bacterium]|nr:hypothetical protein [Actinomycetota bacterium]